VRPRFEPRKGKRADPDVTAWFAELADEGIFLSVLTTGEIHPASRACAVVDPDSAAALDRWLALLSDCAATSGHAGLAEARRWSSA